MEGRSHVEGAGAFPTRRLPAWALGLVPLALIGLALALFATLGGPGLGERKGPPVEELKVERTTLHPGTIELSLRNDGPDAVEVAQVSVNDGFVDFGATSRTIGAWGRRRSRSRMTGSRARRTRSSSLPPPARPSSTRSTQRWRHRAVMFPSTR